MTFGHCFFSWSKSYFPILKSDPLSKGIPNLPESGPLSPNNESPIEKLMTEPFNSFKDQVHVNEALSPVLTPSIQHSLRKPPSSEKRISTISQPIKTSVIKTKRTNRIQKEGKPASGGLSSEMSQIVGVGGLMIQGVGILSVETTMTPYLDELFAQECEEELVGQGTLESFAASLEDIGKWIQKI